jgi:sugar phosphate isomerase/epimerase
MKLAFSTLGCPDWTLHEIVENAAQMGYDGVDFRGLLGDIDISRRPEFTTKLEDTRRLFDGFGLVVSGLAISARYAVVDAAEREKQFDETRRNLALAAALGASCLRVYGGRVPDGYTVETILPTLVANLREIAEEAEQHDVTLALETHDDWTDSDTFARLMAAVDHPRVRVLWDLHHPYRANGEAPEHTYTNLGPYTVNTHVKDSVPTADGGHTYVLLGHGDVPVKQMLDLLIAGGYDGYATLEWEKRWHPELAEPEVVFPQYVQQMRQWFPV